MMIEYMYWAIVSYMGILNDPQTAQGISDEWEPYNLTLLQSTDTLMYNLITDPQYKLPLLAPDGNYCPNTSSVSEMNADKKLLKIVDVIGRESLPQNNTPLFYIYENGKVEKKIFLE
jgi:hypothetical protein